MITLIITIVGIALLFLEAFQYRFPFAPKLNLGWFGLGILYAVNFL